MKPGRFYGVGIGPGDPRYLTLMAVEILRRVDLIFTAVGVNSAFSVSRQVVDFVDQVKAEKRELVFSMARDWEKRRAVLRANAALIAAELRRGRDCAFATLGDPSTYSTFGYLFALLREEMPNLESEIAPGITSFAALAARSQTVLVEDEERLCVLPGQNRIEPENLDLPPKSTTVLLKSYKNRNRLVEYFARQPDCSILYGSRLALEGEFVSRDPQAILARPEEYLSLLIVKRS
ncbi:MAG TPA: precorrin-2 C(20)-methyltransferase [Proteobacteria bacterium]|nr:precorrin-2 C(20)-methyltransferase [Pseudomonadota bacterium]